eukprot:528132-Pelagomonas_calceolata.AAC.1
MHARAFPHSATLIALTNRLDKNTLLTDACARSILESVIMPQKVGEMEMDADGGYRVRKEGGEGRSAKPSPRKHATSSCATLSFTL